MIEIKQSTAIEIVDAIEPVLPFWRDRLGYEVVAEVPHGERLGFALLARNGVEVMLQSRASVEDDLPAIAPHLAGHASVQFIEVASLEAVLSALAGWPLLVPPRETFYGMREIFVADPAGFVIGFAQRMG